MDSQQPSTPDPTLGALLHSRTHTATAHTLAAAFIFLMPTLVLSSIILFTKQNPGVKPYTLPEKLGFVAFIVALSGGAGLFLFLKGLRGRKSIEAYEHGLRLRPPSGDPVTFRYDQVRQLRRRTFKGALAGVEFTLSDGTSHEIAVHGSADAKMLSDILARYGPIAWQPDNSFRIM